MNEDKSSIIETKNLYIYPVNLDKKFKINYTDSPAHKDRLKYSVDFIVPEGTSIKAALKGKIVDVKKDSDIGGPSKKFDKEGNYIEIQHENEEYSIYEHIKQNGALVQKGDKVKTGQIIGYSGATGWIANLGPHLHFDVHKYHKPFGPENYRTFKIRWKEND